MVGAFALLPQPLTAQSTRPETPAAAVVPNVDSDKKVLEAKGENLEPARKGEGAKAEVAPKTGDLPQGGAPAETKAAAKTDEPPKAGEKAKNDGPAKVGEDAHAAADAARVPDETSKTGESPKVQGDAASGDAGDDAAEDNDSPQKPDSKAGAKAAPSSSEEGGSGGSKTDGVILQWQTNDDIMIKASAQAVKGGVFIKPMRGYPQTFRTIGPQSTGGLYRAISANKWPLTTIDAGTGKLVGLIATHWALGRDGRTVYYRLDPAARWSDGEALTSADFVFTAKFLRSAYVDDPYWADYFTKVVVEVRSLDPHLVAVRLASTVADPFYWANMTPLPRHFYAHVKGKFVGTFQYAVEPNSGPYQIDEARGSKDKSIAFVRKKDFWAAERPFLRGRFNVDEVRYETLRPTDDAMAMLSRGEISSIAFYDPAAWYEFARQEMFRKGYVARVGVSGVVSHACNGIWFNTEDPLLQDRDMRTLFAAALDFDKVTSQLFLKETVRLNSCYESYHEFAEPSGSPVPYGFAALDQLLRATGSVNAAPSGIRLNRDGHPLVLKVSYADDGYLPTLNVMAREAVRQGIRIEPVKIYGKALADTLVRGDYQALYVGVDQGLATWPDFRQLWHSTSNTGSGGLGFSRLDDAEIDRAIAAFETCTERKACGELAQKIQHRIRELTIFVPGLSLPYLREAVWRDFVLPSGDPIYEGATSIYDPFDPAQGGLFWFDAVSAAQTQKIRMENGVIPSMTREMIAFRGKAVEAQPGLNGK